MLSGWLPTSRRALSRAESAWPAARGRPDALTSPPPAQPDGRSRSARAPRRLLAVDREAFSRVFAQNVHVAEELAGVIARRRRDLDAVRAEVGASQEEEETNLLSRIGAMFGFGGRATG